MLGKLPVPGRPTNLDYSRARAYCACSRCGWGCLDIFLSSITSLFFLPLSGRWPDIDWNISQKAVKPITTNQLLANHLHVFYAFLSSFQILWY